jgi:hypothetical protein
VGTTWALYRARAILIGRSPTDPTSTTGHAVLLDGLVARPKHDT